MIKAIETVYNGYRFRSRLEARWAVFFDAMEIEYQYEPEGYDLGKNGWYLPDFYLPIKKVNFDNAGVFVEVKAFEPNDKEVLFAQSLANTTKNRVFIVCGDPYNAKIHTFHHGSEIKTYSDLIESQAKDYDFLMDHMVIAMQETAKMLGVEQEEFYVDEKPKGVYDGLRVLFLCSFMKVLNGSEPYGYLTYSDLLKMDTFLVMVKPESRKDIVTATIKARQARFEHGERP